MLLITVKFWIRQKLIIGVSGFLIRSVLLHDNARPRTATLTQQKLEEIKWTTLEHPLYSPDFAPRDFGLPPLKRHLEENVSRRPLSLDIFERMAYTQSTYFYQKKTENKPKRWEKCVTKLGDYVKKIIY